MAKTPDELFAERSRRLMDAYELRQPDRIPVSIMFGYMLAKISGITHEELDLNPAQAQELLEKWALHFQPDQATGLGPFVSTTSVLLGDRQTKWPGYGLPATSPMQYVEGEYMKAEEYDEFLEDPSNFTLHKFLPRAYRELEPLAKLPRMPMLLIGYTSFSGFAGFHEDPAILGALQALAKVSEFHAQMRRQNQMHNQRMAALGFPTSIGRGPGVFAPFDFMSDTLRGMRGIFLDMHRRPDKLLAAQEKVRRICVEETIKTCRAIGSKFAFIPLHRGSDGFMSLEQFETFYWPQLKGLMLDLVEAGIMPSPFYEGVWDGRLQYLRELPKGKTSGRFQSTNIEKLKAEVGDVMSISGCFPASLLQAGSPQEVRAHTREMCRILGKGGGFIMSTNTSMDECRADLVKVWVDATREFGAY
jgi:hypothetical protein